ncbi:MAG: hypothetical protein ACXABY_21775 [Candidatus Thorarchaeota archaeon]|jgi:hypothetical protein
MEAPTERRICFTLPTDEFNALRALLPHGTQDKLFRAIAIDLIPMLRVRQREVLGGILSGEIKVELTLKEKENTNETPRSG